MGYYEGSGYIPESYWLSFVVHGYDQVLLGPDFALDEPQKLLLVHASGVVHVVVYLVDFVKEYEYFQI